IDATHLLLTATATGEATHLGKFTRDESVVLNLADGTLHGTVTFIAANGDLLYADASGGFISATTAVGTYTFTGGSRRFHYAGGTLGWGGVTPGGVHVAGPFVSTTEFYGV